MGLSHENGVPFVIILQDIVGTRDDTARTPGADIGGHYFGEEMIPVESPAGFFRRGRCCCLCIRRVRHGGQLLS